MYNKVDYAVNMLKMYGRTIVADDGNAAEVIAEIRKRVNVEVAYNDDDLGKVPYIDQSYKIYKHCILTLV